MLHPFNCFEYLFHIRPSNFCSLFKVRHVKGAFIMTKYYWLWKYTTCKIKHPTDARTIFFLFLTTWPYPFNYRLQGRWWYLNMGMTTYLFFLECPINNNSCFSQAKNKMDGAELGRANISKNNVMLIFLGQLWNVDNHNVDSHNVDNQNVDNSQCRQSKCRQLKMLTIKMSTPSKCRHHHNVDNSQCRQALLIKHA